MGNYINRKTMLDARSVHSIMEDTCQKIAPLWSLENFVAVNPYWGLRDKSFEEAANLLSKTGGVQMTMPVSFYLDAVRKKEISYDDLENALSGYDEFEDVSVHDFLKQVERESDANRPRRRVALVADVAAQLTAKDWSAWMIERISGWAAAYFDKGQALWRTAAPGQDIFTSWKIETLTDVTPYIMGLRGFGKALKTLPNEPFQAATESIERLQLTEKSLGIYLHTLLQRVGGWSAYMAGLDWDNRLYGGEQGHLLMFLSALLSWESCLLDSVQQPDLKKHWQENIKQLEEIGNEKQVDSLLGHRLILQQAYDNANQRQLIQQVNKANTKKYIPNREPLVQAIFCIDVRSELFRRNLEHVSSRVQTMGVAGFFGFPVEHVPIGHETGENQCPVLIPAKTKVMEVIPEIEAHQKAVKQRLLHHQVEKAWKSFKKGAVSCFSFMGPVGISYLPKMYTDAFGLTRPVPHPASEGIKYGAYQQADISLDVRQLNDQAVGMSMEEQIEMAFSALKAMSFTDHFARIVLIAGHGSSSVNNPHATGLDCGACGGHSGEANSRVAVKVLNNPAVRKGLAQRNIFIPDETLFVAALHDTTTDDVQLLNEEELPESHLADLTELKEWLALAGRISRSERAVRLLTDTGKDIDKAILRRSKDWSQVRPEWGLAGCNTFIVAPRERTAHIDLGGKSFLHSYNWKSDEDFDVLELIMTAPMVVTSWINLQYYASLVDNKNFGSGNKTLHNVTGGIGVLEGYSGDLRVGLPWQSLHDGEQYQHLPHRLNVVIEAPIEAMNKVLEANGIVKNLCDHGWINLLAMNEAGQITQRYLGNLRWTSVSESEKGALVA
ncbi:YbcC family protein [Prolixibacter denitrificans]|uniref:Probable inorganic carbon transporter subunit DabA n=1 Tax=Prolixibacter denitrificans TaxID=1541063 RepID=A0A2P8CAN8_9BACT|nr:DUF2309 domain-containing protein [Prolixibacter denitrificans]PSK82027.1 hypothetical protein CLV93_107141 [Prolixibacter denitrificans]GET22619.1 UPF0753 protein [Prolixibacter denitrificans]